MIDVDHVSPILITGCARSGTSMVAGLVDMGGAFGGQMTGAVPHNPKGQFENEDIRDHLVKPYLEKNGWDRLGQDPLPDIEVVRAQADLKDSPFVNNFALAMSLAMDNYDYVSGPWFYKGAKMCLFWPLVDACFPVAKWIIVRRGTDAIIDSCIRTRFMKAYGDDRDGWRGWVGIHKTRFREMKEEMGDRVREVWPEKMMVGHFSEMAEVIEWLGLNWDFDKANEFIDPKLYHKIRLGVGA